MPPWLAIQTIASARRVVSASLRFCRASARVRGGSGNAAGAAAVSAAPSSTIHIRETILNIRFFILPLALAAGIASAADSGPAARPTDPVLDRYNAAAEKQDWAGASAVLRDAV